MRGRAREADGRHLSPRVSRVFSSTSHLSGYTELSLSGSVSFFSAVPGRLVTSTASILGACLLPGRLRLCVPMDVCPLGCLDTARGHHGVLDDERAPHQL